MKLSSKRRQQIAQRFQAGESGAKLGREFGISRWTVYEILRAHGVRRGREKWTAKVDRLKASGLIIGIFDYRWGRSGGNPPPPRHESRAKQT